MITFTDSPKEAMKETEKIRLVPVRPNEPDYGDHCEIGGNGDGPDAQEKPASFAKTLTQSDANNGGGFSVPRYCAETIFPRLDYSTDPPVSNRARQGRARSCLEVSPYLQRHPSPPPAHDRVEHVCEPEEARRRRFDSVLADGEWGFVRRHYGPKEGRAGPESPPGGTLPTETASQPFRGCVLSAGQHPGVLREGRGGEAAMRVQWCPGMRFKMAFETEDSSRISWFMGTISSVQVPIHSMAEFAVAVASGDLGRTGSAAEREAREPVARRARLEHAHHPSPALSRRRERNCVSPNTPAASPSKPSFRPGFPRKPFRARQQPSQAAVEPVRRRRPVRISTGLIVSNSPIRENISCLLTIGSPSQPTKKSENGKTPQLVLFGQPILTEQQISLSNSADTASPGITKNSSSDGNPEKTVNVSDGSGSAVNQNGHAENSSCEELVAGHCKVFMDSEDVGRTLDLSVLGSYEELYRRLGDMFGIDRAELMSHVRYRDAAGAVKHTGDEPFQFMRSARRLTIVTDAGSDNLGR
uniref:PB1 domain-containing protein n=1 Tax=Ananas comosus var. bracteatus TaxID=296719 RepID=A0A6V7QLC6_ANACO|nr:unnamed protein product [Ananas comosus var. bracteatus]